MSYVTEATTWLPGVSQDVKTLIERFFELADTKQPDVGHVMATELFTRDVVITNPNGTHRGSAGTTNRPNKTMPRSPTHSDCRNIEEQRACLDRCDIKKAYRHPKYFLTMESLESSCSSDLCGQGS
ncbi:hypothetical protein AUP68_08578 [Ilyonectria robusta]